MTGLILCALLLIVSVNAQSAKIAVVIDRGLAQTVWTEGVDNSEVREAVKSTLSNSLNSVQSLQEASDRNWKRCEQRDSSDSGPTQECLRRLVVLALDKAVVSEWLESLSGGKRLSGDAKQALLKAFNDSGFKD